MRGWGVSDLRFAAVCVAGNPDVLDGGFHERRGAALREGELAVLCRCVTTTDIQRIEDGNEHTP